MQSLMRIFISMIALITAITSITAQTFRRVRLKSEITSGNHYLLVAKKAKDTDTVYVMGQQETTGTSFKTRPSFGYHQDSDERIEIKDGNAAIFELQELNGTYRLYEPSCHAWLAYSTSNTTNAYTGLYTLTEEELNSNRSFSALFSFVFDKKKSYIQAKGITRTKFRIQMNQTSNTFRLQSLLTENYGDSLFIYKKESTPATLSDDNGDWTFYGDWTAEQLSKVDFSAARRIDMTGIQLPLGWKEDSGKPQEWVWTYIRKGASECLPQDWCNVIEVYPYGSSVPGKATTPIWSNDSCIWGAKYAFSAVEGITWERIVHPDSGWYSFGSPYRISAVREGSPNGTPLAIRKYRMEYKGNDFVYLEDASDESIWEAAVPYLWSAPDITTVSHLFFYAETADITPPPLRPTTDTGCHIAERQYDILNKERAFYLLNETGSAFTLAAEGSWIAPTRVYLTLPTDKTLRLIFRETSRIESHTGKNVFPVYNLQGIRMGTLREGDIIPKAWPSDVYLTPKGKIRKR